jgi:hypothetical protein
VTTTRSTHRIRQRATKELALLTSLLFLGLVIMPILIYNVGEVIFGAYGGLGYGDFFGTLSTKIRNGDIVAWFLILSPYLGWQCVRLMMFAWRITASSAHKV